jgi:uncharacterized membrane protein
MPVETQTEKDTTRIEAFSDGVFAIAITLLVLEIKVPHLSDLPEPTSRALLTALAHEWPSYFSLVTSFLTVLIMWMHHHRVMRLVRRTDARLLFANGLLLLFVSVVPFPTALIAEYLGTPAAPAACTVYAGVFVGIGTAFLVFLSAAFRKEALVPDAPASTITSLRRSYLAGPPLYLLATIAAPFSPWLAMGICTALWILWAATTQDC